MSGRLVSIAGRDGGRGGLQWLRASNVRLGLRPPKSWIAARAFPSPLDLRFGMSLDRSLENSCPIELDVRVVLLEQPDRVLVQRGAPDTNPRRSAEPIEDARPGFSTSPAAVDDERVFVPALVAIEAKVRQKLLPFLRSRPRLACGGR
jgi:hypothetical protein